MNDCQLYSALLELKFPWKVDRVSLDSTKKTVEIYIIHKKGFETSLLRLQKGMRGL